MPVYCERNTKCGVSGEGEGIFMNRKIIAGAAVFLTVLSLSWIGSGIFGAESGAGTAGDPVVTKSYVDALFASVSQGTEAAVFEVVEVDAGASLIGGAGTELILRGGKATAIDNGADGVSDLTAGKDLRSGTAVALNHLLLVPRADGRGLRCESKSWVMVKGAYTIQ